MAGEPGARARRGRAGGGAQWSDLPGPALRLVIQHLAGHEVEVEGLGVPQALYTMGRVCLSWHAEVRDYLMGDTAASRRKRKWVAARSGGGRSSSGAGLALCAEGRSNSEESESVGALPHGTAPQEAAGGPGSGPADSPRPRGQEPPQRAPRQRARVRGGPGAELRGGGSSCRAQVLSGAGGRERGGAAGGREPADLSDDEEEEVAWGGLAGDDAPVDTDPPRATPAIPPDEPPLDEAGPSEARGGNRPGMGNRLGFLTPFGCRFGLPIALPDGWNPRARLEAAFDRRRSGDRSAGPSSDTHSGSLGLD